MERIAFTARGGSAVAQFFDDDHHMRGWDGGWMWLWGSLMMLTWALIVGAVVWFLLGRRTREPQRSRSLDILDERFARGELSVEDYRALRDELVRHGRS